jgi:uncharacterized protein YcfL
MKKLIFILSLVFIAACSANEEPQPDPLQTAVVCDAAHMKRVGAMCVDGTRSSATGSGACSGHNGVSYWLCQ